MDFRSHKMARGGTTGTRNFRKINSKNATKSKYEHTVRTAEEIAIAEGKTTDSEEEQEADMEMDQEAAVVSSAKKDYGIDDIMQLGNKLHLGKKRPTEVTKVISKNNKKKPAKKQAAKSQKMMRF